MQLGPLHFNLEVSVADMLVVLGAVGVAARWIVGEVRTVLKRMDLHEAALLRAGWLIKNRHTGQLEVREDYGR